MKYFLAYLGSSVKTTIVRFSKVTTKSMIVPVMAISNLVLTQQIYSEEINGAHAHNRDRVPLILFRRCLALIADWESNSRLRKIRSRSSFSGL